MDGENPILLIKLLKKIIVFTSRDWAQESTHILIYIRVELPPTLMNLARQNLGLSLRLMLEERV